MESVFEVSPSPDSLLASPSRAACDPEVCGPGIITERNIKLITSENTSAFWKP